jgi:hypothetical protein
MCTWLVVDGDACNMLSRGLRCTQQPPNSTSNGLGRGHEVGLQRLRGVHFVQCWPATSHAFAKPPKHVSHYSYLPLLVFWHALTPGCASCGK